MKSLLYLFGMGLLLQSCGICERGTGSLGSETRTLDPFQSVDAQGSSNVDIQKSADGTYYAEVYDYPNIRAHIITQVVNNQLIIKNEAGTCFRHSDAKVTVYLPDPLYSVTLSGSGEVDIEAAFPDLAQIILSGSGDIESDYNQSIDSLDIQLGGSGCVELSGCQNQYTNILLSGSGNIELQGTTNAIQALLSGSGNIHGFEYAATSANCSLSGSGNIQVNASQTLNASISGSGDIVYMGTPTLQQTRTGSGKIRPR